MPTDHDTVIADLKAEVKAFCEARDWDQFHGAKDLAIGIATEAAELLALFRFATEEDVEEVLDQGRAEIGDQLALLDPSTSNPARLFFLRSLWPARKEP